MIVFFKPQFVLTESVQLGPLSAYFVELDGFDGVRLRIVFASGSQHMQTRQIVLEALKSTDLQIPVVPQRGCLG